MNDVLAVVVVTGRDEAFDALEVIDPCGLVDGNGPGGTGAYIGAGVWLGQDHRSAPSLLEHGASPLLELLRCSQRMENRRHLCACDVQMRCTVGAVEQLESRPPHG